MSKRILIIDDDLQLCEELADVLRIEGFTVAYTTRPEQGKEIVVKDGCDILLLDLKMPQTDGLSLLASITEYLKQSKVLIMSGNLEAQKMVASSDFSSRISATFSKPFDIPSFLQKINELAGSF